MYEIFKRQYRGDKKTFQVLAINNLKPNLKRDYGKIAAYYRKQENVVDRSHLIVQLLEYLNLSHKRDEFSIISACVDRAPELAMKLGLIHPYNSKPQSFNGVFYNQNVREVIVLDETTSVDVAFVRRHWFNINSIRIMTHPYSDFSGGLCDGKYPYSNGGVAVMYINLPLLMLIYKFWCHERERQGLHVFKKEIFVYQVVIPNMLFNHVNVALINRAIEVYNGKSVPDYRRLHPVSTSDYSIAIAEVIGLQLKLLEPEMPDVNNFFDMIPSALGGDTWKDAMVIPDIAPTMHTRWAMELSVLPYVSFMLDYYSKSKNPRVLRNITYDMRKDIRAMETNNEIAAISRLGSSNHLQNIKRILQNTNV